MSRLPAFIPGLRVNGSEVASRLKVVPFVKVDVRNVGLGELVMTPNIST